jgi:hypothetical protein
MLNTFAARREMPMSCWLKLTAMHGPSLEDRLIFHLDEAEKAFRAKQRELRLPAPDARGEGGMIATYAKLAGKAGLNYVWGLLNFTVGTFLGGVVVAVLMTVPKLLSAAARFM